MGKKNSIHMHGILCSYLLYSMKNILTMAAPASHGTCVHDTEHLLKETHSPTHTVNFCKYYKGKTCFLLLSRVLANFSKGHFGVILLFLLHFQWKGIYKLAWFNICWQQSYFRNQCVFSPKFSFLSKIWFHML